MISATRDFFTLFFTPHYDYPDRYDQLRARLTLVAAVTLLLMSVANMISTLVVPLTADIGEDTREIVIVAAMLAMVAFGVAAILVHVGRLRLAALLLFSCLIFAAFRSLENGLGSSFLLLLALPILYAGVIARWRGALLAFAVSGLIIAYYYVQYRQGMTPNYDMVDPRNLPFVAMIAILMLVAVGLIASAFATEVQQALAHSARLVSQLRGVLDISQITAKTTVMDELLPRCVAYIRDRFGIYHVQIFLVDKDRRYANLVASTGDAGKLLLERGYRFSLTSSGVIGQVIRTGEPLIISDKEPFIEGDITSTHRFPRHVNELLPDTRSELVLPLIAGDLVIGALDLQSTRPDTFSPRDVDIMRLLATQVALAIYNTQQFEEQRAILNDTRRMFLEAETTLRESQQINQRLTGQAWKDYMRQRLANTVGYTLTSGRIRSDQRWTPHLEQAVNHRRAVTTLAQDRDGDKQVIAVPVELRGQVIGAIEVEVEGTPQPTGTLAQTLEMVQAVAQRLAVSVDNARLFEQTQELAQQEFELNSISSKIQGVTDIQELAKIALHELGVALDADAAHIRLGVNLQAEARAEAHVGS